MWREPERMRRLTWSRRFRLLLGGEPWTKDEAAALGAYANWLSGPALLLRPALIGVGFLLGLLLFRQPVHALGMGAVAFVLILGTAWMTQRVTVLVAGEGLLQVVSDVDEQWWGRVDTIVVSDAEQIPTAVERDAPDILLLTGASDPVAEGVGPGVVVAHREDDPATVVTLHLTNGDDPTMDLVQELVTSPGPGPDAFRRAGFVFSNSP